MVDAIRLGQRSHTKLRTVPSEFWKPVEKARELLSDQLMLVLLDAARWYLSRASRDAETYVVSLTDDDVPAPDKRHVKAGVDAFAAELGVSPDYDLGGKVAFDDLLEPNGRTALEIARTLLESCDDLVPGDSMVRLNVLVAASLHGSSPDPWLALARSAQHFGYHAAGLQGAAVALHERARYQEALDLDAQAIRWDTDGGVAWNAVIHALSAGSGREALRYAEQFRGIWEQAPDASRAEFRRMANSVQWQIGPERLPHEWRGVLACLPESIADVAGSKS